MSEIFLQIINMSISASYILLAVLLLRLLFKKAPKWITVALWGIVAVRLICPFYFESVLSLIPSSEVVNPNIMTDNTPTIHTGIPILNNTLNPIISESFTSDPVNGANQLQILIQVFSAVWIVGMVSLLIYTIISYARVRKKIGTAVLYKDNIYQSENVISPFVFGIIKPKIYLPFNINEKNITHVVAHEQAHIQRKDHLWKPLGFLLLALHWFNPLMWLGYVLLCRDIELACDEKVIGELDHNSRADYSQALLTCSVNRRIIAACPLAFGEVGVKDRVRSVLSYKKPAFWIIIAAFVACVAVAVCFLTNPVNSSSDFGETDPDKMNEKQVTLMEQYPEYFGLDASEGLDVYVWQMAKNSYSFGLLPHSEQGRYWLAHELLHLRGTSAEEMSVILSTYKINENDIYIIPWQIPTSSYICDWQIISDDEDQDAKIQAYIEYIRQMLSSVGVPMDFNTIYDTATFDIDNDGVDEVCTMSVGPTSGVFSFTFDARDIGKNVLEYHTALVCSQWYDLSFQKGTDGITRVQGITQGETPETHLFDITVSDNGSIILTENGVSIGSIILTENIVVLE